MCYSGCIQQLELIVKTVGKESAMQKQAGKVAWQLPYGDCAFPMAGSSIVTSPSAPGDQYARA